MRYSSLFDNAIFFILLALFGWWTCFCFSKGYALGKYGTDNPLMNSVIASLMGDESKKDPKGEEEPAFDPMQWFKQFDLDKPNDPEERIHSTSVPAR